MSSRSRYDVVVIGAGHNGLVAAAYLARAGRSVLVLERRDVFGGACVTEEVWPGYRVSTAAYLCGLLHPTVIRSLRLDQHGYEILPKDPAFFSPFPDGRALIVWKDDAQTAAEIARFSRRDAAVYPEYEAFLARLGAFVEPWLLRTPPDLIRRNVRDVAGMVQFAWPVATLPRRDLVRALRIATQSVRDFLDGWFESPELKASLATDGVIGARGGPSTPGTAYVLFHHCMGQAAGKRGLWGFVRGGMGGVTEALASVCRSYGAEIQVGMPVEQILVRNGRAAGVVLRGGAEVQAGIVVSNADPKRTFGHLLAADVVPDDFRREIEGIKTEGVAMKINLALAGLPDFRARPGTSPGPQHRATIHIGPTMDYIDRAWADAESGRPSAQPFLEVTIPTTYDPSLAPPGRHLMNIFVQYTPYRLGEGSWDAIKETYADHVIHTLAEYAPNFPDLIIHRHVLSPHDLERDFALTGGDIFHGEMTLDRLFFMRPLPGWAQYRTPLRGLYLCGSGTHPGGGVMGAPGYNAAREILRDLRSGTDTEAVGNRSR
ncbi:MAG TPA: NAD(P)/FAD-dependent oxidoreductase [bacterium]